MPLLNKDAPNRPPRPIWEVFLAYLGIIVTLLGVVLLLTAAILARYHHAIAEVLKDTLRDIGLALLPLGLISLAFEGISKRHYLAVLRDLVREEIANSIPHLAQLREFGLEQFMRRQQLEVSDISFGDALRILGRQAQDKEFLVYGKSLDFVAQQIPTIADALKNGVTLKLLLFDPNPSPWDNRTVSEARRKAGSSIDSLRLLRTPNPAWTGSLELRKISTLPEYSFSSFVRGAERISVLGLQAGGDRSLQCSQVYVSPKDADNFASHLYRANLEKFEQGLFLLSIPQRHKYAYVYAIRDNEIVFIRKRGQNTWELPGGVIEPDELPEETAKREFTEETGFAVELLHSLQTAERDKIAFVGSVQHQVSPTPDPVEILEYKFFPCDALPGPQLLTFPNTPYAQVIAQFRKAYRQDSLKRLP